MSRHTSHLPVKVNPPPASVAPLTTSIAGLSSVRNIFGTAPARRHTVGQMPSTHFSPRPAINSKPAGYHQRNQSSVSSLFSAGIGATIGIGGEGGPKKTAAEKAAERDRQEQARQIFQLSTVNDKGYFLPPSPSLEKQGSSDYFKDNDADYFTTIIISTSPERVRTFLSTESTISPGMFSQPASKIKRSTIPSFNIPPSSSISSQSEPSSTRSSSPASMSQQPSRNEQQQWRQQQNQVVEGEKNSSVATIINKPLYESVVVSVSPSTGGAIPAVIPKRRVIAPADTLSTPPSSPPATLAKDMYFPPDVAPIVTTGVSIPVTPPNSTPKPTTPISAPSTPQTTNFNQRQRLRHCRPHQESPMHRNSRVADEEEDGQKRGSSNKSKMLSKRRAQMSFLTGATSEDEEDLSDIFAHTIYNKNKSSSFVSSSPSDLVLGLESNSGILPQERERTRQIKI
ncbi:hypothetical protein FBU30_001312 [Linnemannia zychae]|nr:hypothetical protein FBU30_001312 [Linnemannia zychae]